jgi:hypothetical protein
VAETQRDPVELGWIRFNTLLFQANGHFGGIARAPQLLVTAERFETRGSRRGERRAERVQA